MTRRQQLAIVVGVLALVLALIYTGKRVLGNELAPLGIGSEAPTFTAQTLDSIPREKSLDAYKGDVVLINIWATWCLPCRGDAEHRAASQKPRTEGTQGSCGERG